MAILITLGWIALILGIVLVVLGFTIAPQAQRPGWGVLILGIVLVLIGYLVPYVVTGTHHGDSCVTTTDC